VQEHVLIFYADFLDQAIRKQKVLFYNQLPNIMAAVTSVSENKSITKYFEDILADYKKSQPVWNRETLKNYFNEWAVLSYEESNSQQEMQVNNFFHGLKQMGLYKDSEIMYSFCKLMVEVSIERALFTNDMERRPLDRLDYRYIESFLKLIVVLLKTAEFNKHEFMSKLFEAIQEVLDADHSNKKGEFNQKPYYRLIINILTAVNNSQFFNPNTH
jgi:CCR4-NOT transcription complex subunit 1